MTLIVLQVHACGRAALRRSLGTSAMKPGALTPGTVGLERPCPMSITKPCSTILAYLTESALPFAERLVRSISGILWRHVRAGIHITEHTLPERTTLLIERSRRTTRRIVALARLCVAADVTRRTK